MLTVHYCMQVQNEKEEAHKSKYAYAQKGKKDSHAETGRPIDRAFAPEGEKLHLRPALLQDKGLCQQYKGGDASQDFCFERCREACLSLAFGTVAEPTRRDLQLLENPQLGTRPVVPSQGRRIVKIHVSWLGLFCSLCLSPLSLSLSTGARQCCSGWPLLVYWLSFRKV